MNSERDFREDYFEQENFREVYGRFKKMQKHQKVSFFDVNEFELLINYYLEENKIDTAIEIADHALSQHPFSSVIQLKKAEVFIEQNKAKEALSLLLPIVAIETSNAELSMLTGIAYSLLGDFDTANKYFVLTLKYTYDDKDEAAFNVAQTFEKAGAFVFAIQYYKLALELNPDEGNYLFDIAFCYEQYDDLQNSKSYYLKYLDFDPLSDNAWYNLGVVYSRLEEDVKALEAYEYAIAINAYNSSALFNLANTCVNKEDYESAIEYYNEFLEIEPFNNQGLYYLGDVYLKQKKYEKAKECFNRCLELDKNYADAYFGLSYIEFSNKNHYESIELLKKAIKFNPENPDYWSLFGDLNSKLDFFDFAEDSYKKALSLNPDNSTTLIKYVDLLIDQKKLRVALNSLLSAQEKNTSDSKLLFQTASVYFLLGDKEKAIEYLLNGMQVNPEDLTEVYLRYPQARFDEEVKLYLDCYNQ